MAQAAAILQDECKRLHLKWSRTDTNHYTVLSCSFFGLSGSDLSFACTSPISPSWFLSHQGRLPLSLPHVQDLMVGDEASELRSLLEVSYPMENGIVRSWEDMHHLWDYTFGPQRLDVSPPDCKILLTEPPMNPLKNRQKIIEVMFESYRFEGVYIAIQAVLTLYAQGERLVVVASDFFPR